MTADDGPVDVPADDTDTAPIAVAVVDDEPAEPVAAGVDDPYETLFHEPPDQWLRSPAEPIGFAHNGFHVDRGQRFREIAEQALRSTSSDDDTHFSWFDPDADSYGRHAMPASD